MTDNDDNKPLSITSVTHGWRRAYLTIDWTSWSVEISWIPVIGFAVYPVEDYYIEDLLGTPIVPVGAPTNNGSGQRYAALMDPTGVILWHGEIFHSTAEWFEVWGEGKYTIKSEKGLQSFDPKLSQPTSSSKLVLPENFRPDIFRPGAKAAKQKPATKPTATASTKSVFE